MPLISKKIVASWLLLAAVLPYFFASPAGAEELPITWPLANAGFEEGTIGWGISPEFKGQISIVDSPVRSGTRAIKIDATVKNNMAFAVGNVKDLTGGAVYEFSAWARTAPGSSKVSAAIKLEGYSATGNTSGLYGNQTLPADGTWKKITVRQRLSGDSIRAVLLLRIFGQGAVIFDDVTFEKVGHAPDITVISPRTLAAEPGQSFQATYALVFRQPWNDGQLPPVTATLNALDEPHTPPGLKNIPVSVTRGEDDRHFNATFTLPAVEPGSYAVHFRSQGNGQQPLETIYPGHLFTTLKERKPGALTENGTLLWNGKPFFPIGMYHPYGPDDNRLLAEQGFNAVQGHAVHDLEKFKATLDEAYRHGLAVDVPLYLNGKVKENLPNALEKVKRFANHPAVLNWKIFDEPHIEADGGVAVEIPAAYRALKAANPHHPFELTLNSPATQKFWSQFCDIVQPDSYPLPRFPLTTVSDMAVSAKKFMQPWQNMSFVLQCGWVPDLSNQPSPEQARSMVYLALINGAKGIWWYSMRDPGWDLTTSPLWPHFKSINAEVQQLSQPILLGTPVPVESSNAQLQATARKHQGKLYLLMTNPGNSEAETRLSFKTPLKTGEGTFLSNKEKISSKTPGNTTRNVTVKLQPLQSETVVFELP